MRVWLIFRNVGAGALIGALAVYFAAQGGGHAAQAIHWDWALYGAATGGAVGLLTVLVPRLSRAPKDWPTVDEFRRGGDAPQAGAREQGPRLTSGRFIACLCAQARRRTQKRDSS